MFLQVCQKFLRNQKHALKGNLSTADQFARATERSEKRTALRTKFAEFRKKKAASKKA